MKARLREIMIQGVLKRTEMSLIAIWMIGVVLYPALAGGLFETLACIAKEDILQCDLLEMNTVDLES